MTPSAAFNRVFDPLDQCLTPAFAKKLLALRADPTLSDRLEERANKANA